MSKPIYTINRLTIEFDCNDATNEIYESHTDLETAKKRLKEIVKGELSESGEWESDEHFEMFIDEHFVSDECWQMQAAEEYTEIRIIENTLND